ncbi:hypothetical protein [Chlamydia vaughanii]|uniref:hypothetical protein n=1 Tax=Chlamydia vaughanii TaxID=3112552 RepID=UPI0032B14D3A
MAISFCTPVSFSQEYIQWKSESGRSTSLERAVTCVDRLLTFDGQGVEVGLDIQARAVYERVHFPVSGAQKCLKIFLALLILPLIVLLAVKLILRFCLLSKYPEFSAAELPPTLQMEAFPPVEAPRVEEVVLPQEDLQVPVSRIRIDPDTPQAQTRIMREFLILPRFTEVQQQVIDSKIQSILSPGVTLATLAREGIHASALPEEGVLIRFELDALPGYVFTHIPQGERSFEANRRFAADLVHQRHILGITLLQGELRQRGGGLSREEAERILANSGSECGVLRMDVRGNHIVIISEKKLRG